MKNLHKSAWAEIRTDNLKNNIALIRAQVPARTALCAVLKADAYGHGRVGMRRFLAENRLVDRFAVGKMSELVRLTAAAGPGGPPTLLLGPVETDELEACLAGGRVNPDTTVFSVYSLRQFRELEALAERLSLRLTVHIRVDGWDSGMGLSYEEFLQNEDRLFPLSVWMSAGSTVISIRPIPAIWRGSPANSNASMPSSGRSGLCTANGSPYTF